jgi:hypothetical protein
MLWWIIYKPTYQPESIIYTFDIDLIDVSVFPLGIPMWRKVILLNNCGILD